VDDDIEQLLAEYEARAATESKQMEALSPLELAARRDQLLLMVGRSVGQLLNLLVREAKARSILELGTSFGYSTVWLAEAAQVAGGRVVSLELHAEKIEYARERLERVGLASFVEFRLGDARRTLPSLSGPLDFVLIDLWKELYVPCLELLLPRLRSGALVVADNMCYPQETRRYAEAYQRSIRSSGRFDSVSLAVGNGIEVSRLIR